MKMKIPLDSVTYDHEKPKIDGGACKKNPTVIEVNGIGNLPRDLVIEILSKLPVKVLCKFRCVSKQWLELLSRDKHFILRHTQQSTTNPLLLFRKYYSSSEVVKQEINDRVIVELTSVNVDGRTVTKTRASVGGPVNTFTSCGPLVLLCCPYRVYVCNPGTEEFTRVPLSQSVSRYCTVGFGRRSSPSETFKIVHLFPNDSFVGDKGMGCEVFSLTDGEDVSLGSWRRTGDCPYKIQTHGLSVCVGGCVYWLVSDEANDSNNKSILSFDLETEQFESISYPKCYSDFEHNLLFLTGFKNYPCLVAASSSRTSVINIWVMKDSKRKTWVKECSFSLSSLDAAAAGDTKISGIVPRADDDGGIVFNTEQHGIIHYNTDKQIFTRIKTDTEDRHKLPCIYYDGFFSPLT